MGPTATCGKVYRTNLAYICSNGTGSKVLLMAEQNKIMNIRLGPRECEAPHSLLGHSYLIAHRPSQFP